MGQGFALELTARVRSTVDSASALPASEYPHWWSLFTSETPSTVVAAVTSKLDKRIKLFAQLSKKGYLHVLEAPRQLAPWVRAEAKARGVAIEPAAITRLVDAVGDDLSRLALTVEQLGLYAGRRAVTSDDVDELVADTRERTVFELTDAIGAADLARASRVPNRLRDVLREWADLRADAGDHRGAYDLTREALAVN